MEQSLNIPYKKEYDENGVVTNPLKKYYMTEYANRKQRRENLNTTRFVGCGKNCHLTVSKYGKYYRRVQQIAIKNGKSIGTGYDIKTIEHYDSN